MDKKGKKHLPIKKDEVRKSLGSFLLHIHNGDFVITFFLSLLSFSTSLSIFCLKYMMKEAHSQNIQ